MVLLNLVTEQLSQVSEPLNLVSEPLNLVSVVLSLDMVRQTKVCHSLGTVVINLGSVVINLDTEHLKLDMVLHSQALADLSKATACHNQATEVLDMANPATKATVMEAGKTAEATAEAEVVPMATRAEEEVEDINPSPI